MGLRWLEFIVGRVESPPHAGPISIVYTTSVIGTIPATTTITTTTTT